jgi:hypothetical protein
MTARTTPRRSYVSYPRCGNRWKLPAEALHGLKDGDS